MTELDPDIEILLSALNKGGLGAFAFSVIDTAIEPDDTYSGEFPDDVDGPIERRDWTREEQLDRADRVVVAHLDTEISATKRLRQLAGDLNVQSLVVVNGPESGPEDDLLSEARLSNLEVLLRAWRNAVEELRQNWNTEDGL